jgi:hypothetical protein
LVEALVNLDEAESVYQILGILLQHGPANQKRFDQINGVNAPLQVVVVYTSRDPKTPDEEKLENIYHCLYDVLMPLENKEKFVKAEGVEFSTSSVLVIEEDEVLNALPNRCSMNCFIIVHSCFLPLFSCSWDAVPHRQPWPPPVQFVILGEGVPRCPSPWPSFCAATTRGLCNRCAEKWVHGHKCPSTVQLQAIEEVWNMLSENEVSELVVKDSEQLMLAFSAVAWIGANTATTLRPWGTVQQHKLLILRRGFLWGIRSEEGTLELTGYDPYASTDRARAIGVEIVSMEEAMITVDFISLHMLLTPAINKMLNDEALAKMKKGVRIINVACGGVIDEDALVRPLDLGIVAHTALDVFTKEPPVPDNKLGLHENVTVTSHLGASTVGTQEGVAIEIAEAVRTYTFCCVCRKLERLAVQLVAGGTVQDLGTHAASLMASRSWMCLDSAST